MGKSDVDSFAVLKPNTIATKPSWDKDESGILVQKYEFANNIEFIVQTFDRALDRKHATALNIKTQSVCVYGHNLAQEIEPFTVGAEACTHAFLLESQIVKTIDIISNEKSDYEIAKWVGWITKRIVRTGFEIVMLREQIYTRDLYWSCQAFCKYYPHKAVEMTKAFELSIQPNAGKLNAINFLQTFGLWLAREVEITFRA